MTNKAEEWHKEGSCWKLPAKLDSTIEKQAALNPESDFVEAGALAS